MRPFVIALVLAATGCSAADPPAEERTFTRTCLPDSTVTGNPQNIEEMVALINSFPKPVSLPCVLESLDRPITLTASANTFSAQPAYGPNNPRIFIERGDLTLAVVTKGEGRALLEFGHNQTETRSLKAELHFPIETEVAPDAPYTRVLDDRGTSCAFCHFNETLDTNIDFAEAYVSEIIELLPFDVVELDYLVWSFENCDRELEPDRCAMFDSIFAHGEVRETER